MLASSRFAVCLCTLLLATTGFGCAAVKVPGETTANAVLKEDVADALKQWELAYGCSTLWLEVIDTKIVTAFDGHSAVEKWTVRSCNGELHSYSVELIPTPGGGTDIGIKKWAE